MSWCRWSTAIEEYTTSDLYIYDSVHNHIVLMVAGRKKRALPGQVSPKLPGAYLKRIETVEEWSRGLKKHEEWWSDEHEGKHWQWEKLPEKWAGYTLETRDVDELIKVLKEMKEDGLSFPEVIFEFAEDAREEYKDET